MYTTVDFLQERGHRPLYARREDSDWYYTCLFHAPDRNPSLRVHPVSGKWLCPVCQESGNLPRMVRLLDFAGREDKETDRAIAMFLDERQGTALLRILPVQQRGMTARTYASDREQAMLTVMMTWWHQQFLVNTGEASSARAYLFQRGALYPVLFQEQLGYAPHDRDGSHWETLARLLETRFGQGWEELAERVGILRVTQQGKRVLRIQKRLVFCCLNEEQQVIFYQARVIGKVPPKQPGQTFQILKYLNPPHLARAPFSLPVAYPVIEGTGIEESPVGPVVLASYHVPSIATLGTGLDPHFLKHYTPPFFLLHDHDLPKTRLVNGREEVYYPGEEQAQMCLRLCQEHDYPAYRVLPPQETKGVDEWVAAQKSVKPLLHKMKEALAQNGGSQERQEEKTSISEKDYVYLT